MQGSQGSLMVAVRALVSEAWPAEVSITLGVGDASVSHRVLVPSEPTPDGG